MLLLIFHAQVASVLCDEAVGGSFGFQLVLFPVSAHQPHSYLPACAGARRKHNPERACRDRQKAPPTSELLWGSPNHLI